MKLKNKKWLTVRLLVLPCLILIIFITYHVYDRYDSTYEYRFCSNQVWAKGQYNLYCTLKFTRITFHFSEMQHMRGSQKTPILRPKDISVKIIGKFYKLSELSYEKIKKFNHVRVPKKSGKNTTSRVTIYTSATPTNDKQQISIAHLNNKGGIVSCIEFEYKGKVLKNLECWVRSNATESYLQFKYKGSSAITLPISLNRLEKSLPDPVYDSRLYTPLSGKLVCFF